MTCSPGDKYPCLLSRTPSTIAWSFLNPKTLGKSIPAAEDLASKPRETTTEFVFPADGAKVPRAKILLPAPPPPSAPARDPG